MHLRVKTRLSSAKGAPPSRLFYFILTTTTNNSNKINGEIKLVSYWVSRDDRSKLTVIIYKVIVYCNIISRFD